MAGLDKRAVALRGGVDLSVYVLLDPRYTANRPLDWMAGEVLSGGATALQLHLKDATAREWLAWAAKLLPMCRRAAAALIINDRADICRASEADGVHVGQDDLPVAAARAILGPEPVIGMSCDNLDEIRDAYSAGADYCGLGPVYPTASKPDAGPVVGPLQFTRTVQAAPLPIVGIGGITAANAAALAGAGAAGLAVISAVTMAAEPSLACRELALAIAAGRSQLRRR